MSLFKWVSTSKICKLQTNHNTTKSAHSAYLSNHLYHICHKLLFFHLREQKGALHQFVGWSDHEDKWKTSSIWMEEYNTNRLIKFHRLRIYLGTSLMHFLCHQDFCPDAISGRVFDNYTKKKKVVFVLSSYNDNRPTMFLFQMLVLDIHHLCNSNELWSNLMKYQNSVDHIPIEIPNFCWSDFCSKYSIIQICSIMHITYVRSPFEMLCKATITEFQTQVMI